MAVSVIKEDLTNIIALIGDNCFTNKTIARKVGCGLKDCSSTRFSLAVEICVVE